MRFSKQARHFLLAAMALTGLTGNRVASAAVNTVRYAILDLSTLGGTESLGQGYSIVNSAGQVVGIADTTNNTMAVAFRTAPNSAITPASNLGTLGGTGSDATSINASGQAVGYSAIAGNVADHAFRTAPNGTIVSADDLGTLGGDSSFGYGINASGQTVGTSSTTGDAAMHAFRTAPTGSITPSSDLGTLGGTDSTAFCINTSGQTAGESNPTGTGNSFTLQHAFRTAPNGVITPATDLGTLGGTFSVGDGINDAGQVVGASATGVGTEDAYRTTANGVITSASDLGRLGGTYSESFGINSLGQAVGTSDYLSTPGSPEHAFFVDVTGPMQDLNNLIPANSGWVLNTADGINDLGQIAGQGTIGGVRHDYLLTPIVVPEPSSLSLLAVGGVALVRRRRSVPGISLAQ